MKKAFDDIMAGLQDALAFIEGDQSAVTRTVEVQNKEMDSRLRENDEEKL